LLDENLSEQLVRVLAPRFSESLHVRLLNLGGASDLELWKVAIDYGCVLVTKDEDFVKLSVLRGFPPNVDGLLLTLFNAEQREMCRAVIVDIAHHRALTSKINESGA
jgi:predicted nuclease of predicted toxin-antitoxin system